MNHFYEKIHGWFDFQDIYSQMVNNFESGSVFVEIGSFLGRSTSYMAVEIINSGKDIKFDCIDIWKIVDYCENDSHEISESLYDDFLRNISTVSNNVNPVRGYSYDIVNNYKDESIDFLFIDGSHDYDSVKRDLIDWLPKVKKKWDNCWS